MACTYLDLTACDGLYNQHRHRHHMHPRLVQGDLCQFVQHGRLAHHQAQLIKPEATKASVDVVASCTLQTACMDRTAFNQNRACWCSMMIIGVQSRPYLAGGLPTGHLAGGQKALTDFRRQPNRRRRALFAGYTSHLTAARQQMTASVSVLSASTCCTDSYRAGGSVWGARPTGCASQSHML